MDMALTDLINPATWWPRRAEEGHSWVMDSITGRYFDPEAAPYMEPIGLEHFFDAFGLAAKRELQQKLWVSRWKTSSPIWLLSSQVRSAFTPLLSVYLKLPPLNELSGVRRMTISRGRCQG